jgi:zinc protease
MTQLIRHIAPEYKGIDQLKLLPLEQTTLNNGIELFTLIGGSQEVTKIDLFSPSGLVQAGKPLLASSTNNLIEEGTTSRTSAQISEQLDFYGAHIGQSASYHHSMVSLVTLTKHLDDTLPIFADIIRNPVFPEKELSIYLNNKKMEFMVDSEKVRTLASRKFSNVIFGAQHPYGVVVEPALFDTIKRDDLVRFHQQTYTPANCQILVSGQPGKNFHQIINQLFGDTNWKPSVPIIKSFPDVQPHQERVHHVPKDGSVQSALRIGRKLFPRNHPDFMKIQVLNTILGGYFGSRLMTSIREEKGYTYGISSHVVPLKHSGFWVITTELKNEVREIAIEDIFHELSLLQNQKVSNDELQLVKNYMLGDLLRQIDGPFAICDQIKGLLENEMDLGFYSQMVETIKTITSDDLLSLAQRYLNRDDFYVVIAG